MCPLFYVFIALVLLSKKNDRHVFFAGAYAIACRSQDCIVLSSGDITNVYIQGVRCRKMPFGKEAILAVLLTALLCVTAASVDDNFTFCEPMNGFLANDSTVSFPSFPPQFSVQIEAVVGQVNFTFREAEYYDGVGQRGRRDVYFSNHHYTLISDFTTDQAFHILYTEGEVTDCSVVPLEYDMATN